MLTERWGKEKLAFNGRPGFRSGVPYWEKNRRAWGAKAYLGPTAMRPISLFPGETQGAAAARRMLVTGPVAASEQTGARNAYPKGFVFRQFVTKSKGCTHLGEGRFRSGSRKKRPASLENNGKERLRRRALKGGETGGSECRTERGTCPSMERSKPYLRRGDLRKSCARSQNEEKTLLQAEDKRSLTTSLRTGSECITG